MTRQRRFRVCLAAITIAGAALGFLWCGRGAAAQVSPLLQTDFTQDAGEWRAFGPTAKMTQSLDSTTGKGTLKLGYVLAKDGFNALVLPLGGHDIHTAKSFRFSLRSDRATTLVASLNEKEGGHYSATFTIPAGKWQEVSLSLADFVLSAEKSAPADPNGKLDLDNVPAFVLTDMAQFYDLPDAGALERSFTMGAFTVSTEPTAAEALNDTCLDTFLEPQIQWVGMGNKIGMALESDSPLNENGLKATYTRSPDGIAGIIRAIPCGKLAGKEAISFKLASTHPATLFLDIEERSGARYSVTLDVAGRLTDSSPVVAKQYRIPFSTFQKIEKAGSSADSTASARIALDQIKNISFADVTGRSKTTPVENSLWIGALHIVEPASP